MRPRLSPGEIITPPVELDTDVPEPAPEDIHKLPGFLHSSPSFRVVLYGTALSMSAVFATAAAFAYLNMATPAPASAQPYSYEQR